MIIQLIVAYIWKLMWNLIHDSFEGTEIYLFIFFYTFIIWWKLPYFLCLQFPRCIPLQIKKIMQLCSNLHASVFYLFLYLVINFLVTVLGSASSGFANSVRRMEHCVFAFVNKILFHDLLHGGL